MYARCQVNLKQNCWNLLAARQSDVFGVQSTVSYKLYFIKVDEWNKDEFQFVLGLQ